ncbi:MAG: hypothetical protein H6613_07900 [Ignavibacteriales bacterium]|nr:hypothetical protein [Ignavibacteriales bacterium]
MHKKSVPRLSPKCYVGQTVGYTNVEITYSSPGVKKKEQSGESLFHIMKYGEPVQTKQQQLSSIMM